MPEELISLKRQRATAKGLITRVSNRAKILITTHPRELYPEGIQQQLIILSKNDDIYNQCQASIIADHSSSVVVKDEEDQLAQHDTDVYEISKVLRNLLDLHEAYKIHDMIERSLGSLENHLEKEPSASPSKEVEDLRKNLQTLLILTGKPLANKDSLLQDSYGPFQSRYLRLEAQCTRNDDTESSSSSASASTPVVKKYNLPKIPIPEFHGDPLDWAPFWERFTTVVDSNTTLSEADKLTYLRAAIKGKESNGNCICKHCQIQRLFYYCGITQEAI